MKNDESSRTRSPSAFSILHSLLRLRSRSLLVLACVPLSIALPLWLVAFSSGPMPNMTGGFGEPTCRSCHLDEVLNAPGGSLRVTGIPETFQRGHAYEITVRLQREDLRRGGFEIGARFSSGADRGMQAGEWRPLDARVQLQKSADGTLSFAQHTTAGTLAATRGALQWSFEWVAPSHASAPVQFNTAANASNDDASPLGDCIYTDEQSSKIE
jgi:hypothetical protein